MKLPKIFKRHLAVFFRRYLQVEVIISVFQPPQMKKRYHLSFYISVIRFKIYFYCLVLWVSILAISNTDNNLKASRRRE